MTNKLVIGSDGPAVVALSAEEITAKESLEATSAAEKTATAYKAARVQAYGTLAEQIEYITENGLAAWQAHVAAIKAQYPKPE